MESGDEANNFRHGFPLTSQTLLGLGFVDIYVYVPLKMYEYSREEMVEESQSSPTQLIWEIKEAAERSFTVKDISMPLKRETLSMNKGYPRTLWNVIYMHKLRCEARGW